MDHTKVHGSVAVSIAGVNVRTLVHEKLDTLIVAIHGRKMKEGISILVI